MNLRQQGLGILKLAAAASVAAGMSLAHATDGAGGRPAQLPFMDEQVFQECGMSCLYERGSESLSLQARFIEYRLQLLDAKLKEAKSGKSQAASEVLNELQMRCTPGERASRSVASAGACLGRFRQDQLAVLSKIRGALVAAGVQVVALRPEQGRPGLSWAAGSGARGSRGGIDSSDSSEARLPQAPFIPSYNELEAQHDADQRLQGLGSQEYQKWLSEMPRKPSADEFLKFRRLPKDPSDPGNEEKITVLQFGADGKPMRDDQAYARALQDYEARLKDWEAGPAALSKREELKKNGTDLLQEQRFQKRVGSLSKKAFSLARQDMMGAAAQVMKKVGMASSTGTPDTEEKALNEKISPRHPASKRTRAHVIISPEALNREIESLGGSNLVIQAPSP
jgi:hypothetical protein